ncbi:hypothetical protein [Streptomyces sp. XD-27]|uniref:hypothetical protein n=1 Tax=Streptomyces sp. XD-27 TaxID=3062779 RepID=UPI0026F420C4|nr:hypothetical protein [Streptomyces sp. XD-27]WKX71033.1 hypothetical protein Q3Y56_14945 [Streptomyces sp. XD-27]
MSAATISPTPAHGATAFRSDAEAHPRHFLGNAIRAVKVFASTAVSVVLLGEYGDEVRRAK